MKIGLIYKGEFKDSFTKYFLNGHELFFLDKEDEKVDYIFYIDDNLKCVYKVDFKLDYDYVFVKNPNKKDLLHESDIEIDEYSSKIYGAKTKLFNIDICKDITNKSNKLVLNYEHCYPEIDVLKLKKRIIDVDVSYFKTLPITSFKKYNIKEVFYITQFNKLLKEWVKNYLIQNEIKSVLDVGCGKCDMYYLCLETNVYYNGIDTDNDIINYAKSLDIECELKDINEDFDRKFDLVFCKDVIQYMFDKKHAIKNCLKLSCKTVLFLFNKKEDIEDDIKKVLLNKSYKKYEVDDYFIIEVVL